MGLLLSITHRRGPVDEDLITVRHDLDGLHQRGINHPRQLAIGGPCRPVRQGPEPSDVKGLRCGQVDREDGALLTDPSCGARTIDTDDFHANDPRAGFGPAQLLDRNRDGERNHGAGSYGRTE